MTKHVLPWNDQVSRGREVLFLGSGGGRAREEGRGSGRTTAKESSFFSPLIHGQPCSNKNYCRGLGASAQLAAALQCYCPGLTPPSRPALGLEVL